MHTWVCYSAYCFDLLKGLFGGKSLIASVAMSSLIKGRMRVYMNVGTYISVCAHKHAHAHTHADYAPSHLGTCISCIGVQGNLSIKDTV